VQTKGPYGGYICSFGVNGNNIYAGSLPYGKIYLSTNSGQNWRVISNGLFEELFIHALCPNGNNLFAGTNAGVYLTTDNGSNWITVNTGLTDLSIFSLLINGSNIFAGVGTGIFLSTNNGTSWNSAGLTGYQVNYLTVNNNKIYAGTDHGLFVSDNNGSTWISAGFYSSVISMAFKGSYIFAGTDYGLYLTTNNGVQWNSASPGFTNVSGLVVISNKLYAGISGGVLVSTDNGLSWNYVNSGLPAFPTSVSLALCNNNLIVSCRNMEYETGIFLSSDNGSTWNPVNDGFINSSISNFSVSSGKLYAGTGCGIFLSTDEGIDWTRVSDYWSIQGMLVNGDTIFAAVPNEGIFRSTNEGSSWIRANNGISNMFPNCFAVFGNIIYAGTSQGVYSSTDNGLNWITAGISNLNFTTLVVKDSVLFAGTSSGVYFSSISKPSWNPLNNGLPATSIRPLTFSGNLVFAGTTDGIYSSTNKGTNWKASGLSGYNVTSIGFSNNEVFVGTRKGFFISDDSGSTWQPFIDGLSLPAQNILSTILNGDYIYAGTGGNGIWRRKISEITPVELIMFNAYYSTGKVVLNWSTASEINNSTFEVQRRMNKSNWITVGIRKGNGTTTETKNYSFVDNINNISAGKIYYRLKQIDFNGKSELSREVLVDNIVPSLYSLEQNYPNPFNPGTIISYRLKEKGFVKLRVYDIKGEVVKVLVNETKEAGYYQTEFDARGLASGVYVYRIEVMGSGNVQVYSDMKKTILLK